MTETYIGQCPKVTVPMPNILSQHRDKFNDILEQINKDKDASWWPKRKKNNFVTATLGLLT